MMCEADFRTELQRITDDPKIGDHWRKIEALRSKFPHQIALGPALEVDGWSPNCFAVALGLYKVSQYCKLARAAAIAQGHGIFSDPPPRFFVNSSAFEDLLSDGTLTRKEIGEPGDIILYRQERSLKHAGVLVSASRVFSQWGFGNSYQHERLEVPSSYGVVAGFASKPDGDAVLRRFLEIARADPRWPGFAKDWLGGNAD